MILEKLKRERERKNQGKRHESSLTKTKTEAWPVIAGGHNQRY